MSVRRLILAMRGIMRLMVVVVVAMLGVMVGGLAFASASALAAEEYKNVCKATIEFCTAVAKLSPRVWPWTTPPSRLEATCT